MIDNEKKSLHRILIIDDNQSIHQDFAKILTKATADDAELYELEAVPFGTTEPQSSLLSFALDYATQGAEGVTRVEQALAKNRPYALAFVDGRMSPGMDGIETIQELWKKDPELQIVLCTAYAGYSWQEIYNILGETDSLLILKKPFDNMEVLQMAHTLVRKWELAKEIKSRLHQLVFYDPLTGLPNKAMLSKRLEQTLKYARQKKSYASALFIDMNNFKLVNDSLGHGFGDKLIQGISERIVFCLRALDIVSRWTASRLGGDKFVIVLSEIASEEAAAVVAQRITDSVSEPLEIDGHQILVTLSIGIAIYPQDGQTGEELLKNADLAMYAAKRNSQNAIAYYQESMNMRAVKRLALESSLRQALEQNEFFLHYQPQQDIHTGKISGMEALLRWCNPALGQVPPLEFIEVAEELGLIVDIGTWVLRTACAQTRAWRDLGLPVPRIAVNVSIKQLIATNFVDTVKEVLAETGLDPQALEIEITETLFGENDTNLEQIVQELKQMEISIAIDDFGTGYAGVNRFRKIEVDYLKIDRSFICEIESSVSAQNLIRGVVALAKCLNINVISEGIETIAQMNFLRSIGCQQIQGYLYSKPLAAEEVEAFLRNLPEMGNLLESR